MASFGVMSSRPAVMLTDTAAMLDARQRTMIGPAHSQASFSR